MVIAESRLGCLARLASSVECRRPSGGFCAIAIAFPITTSTPEPVLVVVDRSEQQWDVNSYFVVDQSGQLEFQWFETATEVPLAAVIVVVRPKRILDEEVTKDSWQIDE